MFKSSATFTIYLVCGFVVSLLLAVGFNPYGNQTAQAAGICPAGQFPGDGTGSGGLDRAYCYEKQGGNCSPAELAMRQGQCPSKLVKQGKIQTSPSGQAPTNHRPNNIPTDPNNEYVKWCTAQYSAPASAACVDGAVNGLGNGQYCAPSYKGDNLLVSACEAGYNYRHQQDINKTKEIKRCDAQWLGWIVCWVSRFIGQLIKGVFNILSQLMITPPVLLDPNSQLYKQWSVFRNIANVLFVILFLIIVLSHVTNAGIDNYNLKRIVPRLVVGVLLINISYLICSLLVDLSNIAGSSLYRVLSDIADAVGPLDPRFGISGSIISSLMVLGGGALIYLNILALTPMLVSALFAILTTVVLLTVREALIIIFVVLSPLAFALNILPSTQSWFSKWWKNFSTMLMLFPVISFVFGISQLLAIVITKGTPQSADPVVSIIFTIIAIAAQITPFFFAPLLVKMSGQLVNQAAQMVNAPINLAADKVGNEVGDWAENREKIRATNALTNDGKGLYSRYSKRKNRKDKVAKYHEEQLKDHKSGVYGNFVSSDVNRRYFIKKLSRDAKLADRVEKRREIRSGLENIDVRLDVESIDAANVMLTDQGYTLEQLKHGIETGEGKDGNKLTETEKLAAIKQLAQNGTLDNIHELCDKLASENASMAARQQLVSGLQNNVAAQGVVHLGNDGQQQILNGASTGQLYQHAVDSHLYSAESMSAQPTSVLQGLEAYKSSYSTDGLETLRETRDIALKKDKTSVNFTTAGKRLARGL